MQVWDRENIKKRGRHWWDMWSSKRHGQRGRNNLGKSLAKLRLSSDKCEGFKCALRNSQLSWQVPLWPFFNLAIYMSFLYISSAPYHRWGDKRWGRITSRKEVMTTKQKKDPEGHTKKEEQREWARERERWRESTPQCAQASACTCIER